MKKSFEKKCNELIKYEEETLQDIKNYIEPMNKILNKKGLKCDIIYDFYMNYGGKTKLKMISYISNLIFGSSLWKIIFISGVGAGLRWIIDKLIPEI